VVRESQEAVELALKGLLRSCGVEAPRIHDVSDVLLAERERLRQRCRRRWSASVPSRAISGAIASSPSTTVRGPHASSFYSKADAVSARDGAVYVVPVVRP
jgi:HEPN domain-containing protein